MTEAEWLGYRNPTAMAQALGDRLSDRSARLFICACCRMLQERLLDPRAVSALNTAERYLDGKATSLEVLAACRWAKKAAFATRDAVQRMACYALEEACSQQRWRILRGVSSIANALAATRRGVLAEADDGNEELLAAAADLFREVVRPPWLDVRSGDTWCAWEGGIIPRLATAMRDEGAFDRLPILADALEDAGCADEALLAHLRGPGPHVRGCWALDLVLGKE